MIFYFQMDFEKIQDKSDLEYKMGMLLQNHREGKLFLILNRKEAKWISENLSFNSKNEAMLQKIIESISVNNSILEKVKIKAKIIEGSGKFVDPNGSLSIGIDNLFFNEIIDTPVLVVENLLSDGKFIEYILTNLHEQGFPGKYIKIFLSSGNGSQVDEHADFYIGKGRIVSKLKDSDVISPLKSIKNFSIEGFCYNFILPCHEIENVFSENVIGIVSEKNYESNKTLDMLRCIRGFEKDEVNKYFFFFDLKKGINRENFNKLPSGPEKNWIESKIKLVCDIEKDFEYKGFGDNLWKSVQNNNEAMKQFVQNIRSNDWKNFFFDFFQKMKWIFIASPPTRT